MITRSVEPDSLLNMCPSIVCKVCVCVCMSVCVCVYVCMCVCVCVCVNSTLHVPIIACPHTVWNRVERASTSTPSTVSVYVCIRVCMYVCVRPMSGVYVCV